MPRKLTEQQKEDLKTLFDQKLGRQIKKKRIEKGIRLIEISDALDIPVNYLERIEDGKIRLTVFMLRQILEFLGVEKYTIIKKEKRGK